MFNSMNGVVMGESLLINRPTSEEQGISEEAIREELSRILESSMFIQSDRLSRFLRFTVEATLPRRGGDAEGILDRHGGLRSQTTGITPTWIQSFAARLVGSAIN